MNITYRKATLADIPAMQRLVKPEIDSGIILVRTDNEVATNIRSYHLVFDQETLVGFLALHIHTPSLAEVRSLIIHSDYRSRSIGTSLVENALEEGVALGIKEVLALTYHREFFEKMGFKEIPKESLPESKIWADCIKCKHFPVCNEISLVKPL